MNPERYDLVCVLTNNTLVPSETEDRAPLSPASSGLSEAFDGDGEPPNKRRKVSYSSLSSDSDEADDEKPLAASRADAAEKPQKSPRRNGKGKTSGKSRARPPRGGKSMASMKSKAHITPAHIPPPTDAERKEMERPTANERDGREVTVKVEDKMDESQLSRLVTGVTVDAGGGAASATVRPLSTAFTLQPHHHLASPESSQRNHHKSNFAKV